MKVLEHEAKVILAGQGMLVPLGKMAFAPDEALAIANQIGRPVIIKAQVPTGGRMKAGGVKYADTPAEALAVAQDLIGCTLLGHQINSVLVEERVASLEQFYIAVTYDNRTRQAVVLASRDGGIEIESKSKMLRCPFSLL
ncbi:MAG: acetate--CoA ligase family protein, partial [Proteobacteria bacterium]|nr:acetate--CoA ligase family protein [Pseudomonadota bacterium]